MPKLTVFGILEWFLLVSRADLDRALQTVQAIRSRRRWAPVSDGSQQHIGGRHVVKFADQIIFFSLVFVPRGESKSV